jgi:MFS family permease
LAIGGLYLLSGASGFAMILVAATLYGFGKTFFWPTMLGVVSEQTPKGGALTLNAISGIGMLAVGMLGTPFIGKLLEARQIQAVAETPEAKKVPGLLEGSTLSASVLADKTMYEVIPYKVISDAKLADAVKKAPADEQEAVTKAFVESRKKSSQWALADMALFPAIMLAGYIALILYFQSRGGYKPVELAAGGGGGDKAVH